MTEVVAALIWRENRFLACQRPAHKARGLLWEFVGGKVEPGESAQEALIRECMEELAVTIRVGSVFMEVTHQYPDITVHLTLFNASILSGELQLLEHNALAWITTEEIDSLAFCPADVDILKCLKGMRGPLDACLYGLSDAAYQAFQSKLMPDVDPNRVIGVRMPELRKLSRHLSEYIQLPTFLEALPHRYYEENNLHALHINARNDYSSVITELDRFLPFVDNWATCDLLSPKVFQKHPDGLLDKVKIWLLSPHLYTRRFAIGVLMRFYLGDEFLPEFLQWVIQTPHEEYYVSMMIAWYLATALAKQYAAAVEVLEKKLLDPWTHNKTIQKALESYRISSAQKEYLRKLKIYQKEGNHYG